MTSSLLTLASIEVKTTLLIALALLAMMLLRRSSAALRHRIWAIAIILVLLLPVEFLRRYVSSPAASQPAVKAGHVRPQQPIAAPLLPAAFRIDASQPVFSPLIWPYIIGLWAAGCMIAIARTAVGMRRLRRVMESSRQVSIAKRQQFLIDLSERLGVRQKVLLLESDDIRIPLTWGHVRPAVMLPAEHVNWSEQQTEAVLTHELAHIKRSDWLTLMLTEAARALHWFNPLVWIAARQVRRESEYACDDEVIVTGVASDRYAQQVLELARNATRIDTAVPTAVAMARPSDLERRFTQMLNPFANRTRVTRWTNVTTGMMATALFGTLAAVQVFAQANGRLSGSVYDPSGAAVPNATLIISNPVAHSRDMTTTNASGNYEFSAVNTGDCTLEVLMPGFAKHSEKIELSANTPSPHNVSLQMGSINERVEVTGQGVAREAGTAVAPVKQLRIGGNVQAAKLVRKVTPKYPVEAKQSGIQGAVLLEAVIGREGELLSLRVQNSQIDPNLAKAAVEAVSQWRYQPTLLNGEPVEVITTINVNFTLAP